MTVQNNEFKIKQVASSWSYFTHLLPTSYSLLLTPYSLLLTPLFPFIIYLLTLAPSITWQHGGADSGDLAAAVATLGIPHPPGYPTYVLLGYLWTALPLGGDVAYRLNLLSAVGATVAVGLTALTIFDWNLKASFEIPKSKIENQFGAMVGGWLLAFSPLTWSQATMAEVYAPGLAMLALLSWLLLKPDRFDHKLALAGFIGGLGFGLLPQIILVIPGAVGLLYSQFFTRPDRFLKPVRSKSLTSYSLLLTPLLGLSVFLYLPLRAATHPLVNWGDPSTLGRFWAVVTVAQYQQYFGLLTPSEWGYRFGSSLVELGQALSWGGVALAGLGVSGLWRADRPKLAYIVSLVGLTLLFRTSYPVMGNIVYLLPALYGLALLAGYGTTWLLRHARPQLGQHGTMALGLFFVVTLGIRTWLLAPQLDLRHDDQASRFGERIFATLPANAVVMSKQDETTFSLWYRQALGERADVVVIDKRLLAQDWYRHNLAIRYPNFNLDNITNFYEFNEQLELEIKE